VIVIIVMMTQFASYICYPICGYNTKFKDHQYFWFYGTLSLSDIKILVAFLWVAWETCSSRLPFTLAPTQGKLLSK